MVDDTDDYESLPSSSSLKHHMLAGACAGIMEHSVMYPVDSVKTRMQCILPLAGPRYTNVFCGISHLIRSQGVVGSLRGVGAVIGGAGPAHALYFGCYERMKKVIYELQFGSAHLAHAISGACATLLHDAIMTPADAVKQRLQMYNSPYHNSIDCLGRVLRNEGFLVLYRAYFTQLSMSAPYQVSHFVIYEIGQDFLNPSRQYQPSSHMLSGALAGCLAAAVTNPLDVCKTILNTQQRCFLVGDTNSSPIRHSWSGFAQLRGSGHNHHHHHHHSPAQSQISSEHQASRPASFSAGTANATSNTSEVGVSGNRTAIKGLLGACRIVYQLEGPGGFTRGIVARILTSMPGAAISWSVYEYFKWWFGQTRHKSSYPTPSLPPPSGPGFITAAAAPDDIEPGDRTGHSASSGAAGSISIFFSSSASTPSTTAASTGLPVI